MLEQEGDEIVFYVRLGTHKRDFRIGSDLIQAPKRREFEGDRQWSRPSPLLPTDTRGVLRADDRRVISGIAHVLRSGCRWKDAPAAYGPHKTLYNRFVRWAAKGVWTDVFHALASTGGPAAEVLRQHVDEGPPLRHGRKRGQRARAIGVSRGGRSTKLHAISDDLGRPLAFAVTGGQAADCRAAELLLHLVPPGAIVLADRGYDTNAVRSAIEARDATPNIPPKRSRRW